MSLPDRYMRELPPQIVDGISAYVREKESLFSPFAAKTSDAVRRYNKKPADIRTPYSRDTDRIIHTKAYARYIDKTQVFYLVRNDHITHRVLHVQIVSKIARTIGRSLRLNEDLIEAIALGHDIGHIPYGHTGEECLSEICVEHGIGSFRHNVQSLHSLQDIEDCDLTLQVADGILCHNGERYDDEIRPAMGKDWETLDQEVADLSAHGDDFAPMTLEGCVVRFADTIAYIGRDIDDAWEVGFIPHDIDLPGIVRTTLGDATPVIIDTLIKDLIEHSDSGTEPVISYSDRVADALQVLKEFNYRNIYHNENIVAQKERIMNMYRTVFPRYLEDLRGRRRDSKIFTDFTDATWISGRYCSGATDEELVRDFIAGMTDRYFLARFREMVFPSEYDGKFR